MFGHRFYGARYYGPRYWGDGGTGTPVVVVTPTTSGVHRARFLRRAKRHELPWEVELEESDVVIAKPIRKRIRLPEEIKEALADTVPFETHVVIDAPEIKFPGVGTAKLRIDTSEEEAILMAIL